MVFSYNEQPIPACPIIAHDGPFTAVNSGPIIKLLQI